jgi:hypothetical protein
LQGPQSIGAPTAPAARGDPESAAIRAAGRQDRGERHDRRETAVTHRESALREVVAPEVARRSGVAEVRVERSAFGLADGPARWGCEPDEVASPPPIDAAVPGSARGALARTAA